MYNYLKYIELQSVKSKNTVISLSISSKALKFDIFNICNVLEGGVSQLFHLTIVLDFV